MQGEGTWIWFEDEVRGPFPTWEVELVASKCRHILVCDRNGRWVRYGDWDRQSVTGVRPAPPPPFRRFALALSRAVFRRLLRIHH